MVQLVTGPANRATALRAALTLALALVVGVAVTTGRPLALPAVAVGALVGTALVLDGVDGWLARRTGSATALGARFDMEVDALLVLVLAVGVARDLGAWVLLLGAARYLLAAAVWVVPWLGAPVPATWWRKAVAVAQSVALGTALTGLLPRGLSTTLVAAAGAALAVSFGTQVAQVARVHGGVRARRVATTLLALAVLDLALVLPPDPRDLAPAALARVPLEGVVLVPLLALLRGRLRPLLLRLLAASLGALLLLRALDLGFGVAFDRRFDPLSDWRYASAGLETLAETTYPLVAAAVGLAALVALVGVLALLAWSVRTVAASARLHRRALLRAGAVLGAAVAVAAGTTPSRSTVVAHETVDLVREHVGSGAAAVRDGAVFARLLAADPYAATPGPDLLAAVRGKDVVVVFVESYGRVALGDPRLSGEVGPALADLERRGRAAGLGARSAWLTSPTFGGLSRLAHATLHTGVRVDSEARYAALATSGRATLAGLFRRAGWRTLAVVPANTRDWPEGRALYHWQTVRDSRGLGYRGPALGYPPVPDELTLKAFAEQELRPGHAPVMAEVDLVTSHAPWTPVPRLLPWAAVGDGSAWATAHDDPPATDPVRAYAAALAFSLRSLAAFVEHSGDPELVLLVLGDHQPNTTVTGPGASHDVPVTLLASDPAVLAPAAAWGWTAGVRPGGLSPVWPMEAVRDRLLGAWSRPHG